MNYHRALRVSDFRVVPLIASILLFLPTILMAGETPERLAKVDAAVDLVTFEPQIAHNQMRVTVSGPGGFQIVRSFEADEPAGIDLPGATIAFR